MTRLIKDTLADILGSYNDPRFKLLKNWHACLGALCQHVRLERIYNDVVILGVYDRMWMNELYMLSHTIIASINQALGSNDIQQLQLRLVNRGQSSVRKNNMRVSNRAQKSPERMLSSRENNALERITDPQLRQSLYAFLMKISETTHGT